MKVNFLSNNYCNTDNYSEKYRSQNKNSVSFKAHPDFDFLAKKYEVKASSYFRRGQIYGSPCDSFADVIRTLNKIFGNNSQEKKKMLIAGIGDSQEPFSLLAVIKYLTKDKPIKDVVDLNIIDLQSKPSNRELFDQSYFDGYYPPDFVKSSFIRDDGKKYGLKTWKRYRVKSEIFQFLKDTYNNPQKSHWDSRVQDVVKDLDSDYYDVVSINNTLGYINNEKDIYDTLDNVKRIAKKDSAFITDPYSKFNDSLADSMTEEYNGIFRKR